MTRRLKVPALEFIGDVIASARRDRHHRESGILTTLRDKAGAVSDEDVLYVPGLIPFVQD